MKRDPRLAAAEGDPARTLRIWREIWEEKPLLRIVYRRWARRIARRLTPGRTLVIGAGAAPLDDLLHPRPILSDIVSVPWLDLVMDAHAPALRSGSIANVVAVDVIHHLARPEEGLAELIGLLPPGGRLIAMEPYLSRLSGTLRRRHHHEGKGKSDPNAPLDSDLNAAQRIFFEDWERVAASLPHSVRVLHRARTDPLLYPLSGGFNYPARIPVGSAPIVAGLESILAPFAPLLAFKFMVVMERES